MSAVDQLPAWDGVMPLDVWKWKRQQEIKRITNAQSAAANAKDASGAHLYRVNDAGNLVRTQPVNQSKRRKIHERDGLSCVWCGSTDDLEVDHIVRYIDGGGNDPTNLRTLCHDCHASRGGRP